MSLSLGSGVGRARSPGVAPRPTGARCTGACSRTRWFTERASARSARRGTRRATSSRCISHDQSRAAAPGFRDRIDQDHKSPAAPPPSLRQIASLRWCCVSFGLRPRLCPFDLARARPSDVRARISSRSNSALCGALHNADNAERVVMRSVVAGVRVTARLRRCRAPHNPRASLGDFCAGGRYDRDPVTGAEVTGSRREAISASGALKRPRRKAGGRTASTASSFSDGSSRR